MPDLEMDASSVKVKKSGTTTCAIILGIILAVCVLVIVILSILLAVGYNQNTDRDTISHFSMKDSSCTSADCVMLSASVIASMNLSADPCQDFYTYACGNWKDTVTIEKGAPSWSSFEDIMEGNTRVLEQALKTPGNEYLGVESEAVGTAKTFYSSCIDTSAIDARGAEPLMEYISELGSCPLLNGVGGAGGWDSNTWSLEEVVAKAHRFNKKPLFLWDVTEDFMTHINTFWFDQGGLLLGRSPSLYLGDNAETNHENVVNLAEAVFTLLGARGNVRSQIEDIWRFEVELARLFTALENRTDFNSLYNTMTISDLQQLIGTQFDFRRYFQELWSEPIEDSEEIIVANPDFYSQLGSLINRTPRGTLANYVVNQMVIPNIKYLSAEFVSEWEQYKKKALGDSTGSEPAKDCQYILSDYFPDVTGALYVEAAFGGDELKRKIEDQLETIVEAFTARIDKLDWMDEATKSNAREKVDRLDKMIGYPELIMHPDQLDEQYNQYTFTDDFFGNIRSLYYVTTGKELGKRGELPDDIIKAAPNLVNAYYDFLTNRMVFLAGILQSPFYNDAYPPSLNYGAIGMVMGHELTHGFDNQGRQFDAYGRLVDWWSPESSAAFTEKSQCLIDQYNAYPVGDTHVNGRLTLGENMADNGGLKTAYDAYIKYRQSHQEELIGLIGLPLSDLQLFFLGFAKPWCGFMTPEYATNAVETDVHTVPNYRIIGVVQNMQEFADAFSCPRGAQMNPDTKCVVW